MNNCKKVTLIHNSWIAAYNGGNTVMRFLLESKQAFEKENIAICQCTLDTLIPRSFATNDPKSISTKYKLRSSARIVFNWLSLHHAYFTWIFFRLNTFRTSKKVVDYYLSSNPSENEVAFFHTIIPCYFYLKERTKKQPTVLVMHTNGDAFQMERIYYPKLEKSKYYKRLLEMYQYTIENVDRINFVAEEPRLNFLRLHPEIDPQKVFYIHNGVSDKPEIVRTSIGSPIEICCVGSISDRKGQQFIVDALKKLTIEERNQIHFTLLGDGSMLIALEEEAAQSGIAAFITFAGVRSDVENYLRKSDIFILPSKDEGLPIAILEAMRASLPIISTPVGGIPEMLKDGYNGVMMEPNAEALYNILKNINSYDWLTMGKNARLLFEEKFSGRKMVQNYAKLLSF